MRKAFDSNVPRVKPRLRPHGAVEVVEGEAAELVGIAVWGGAGDGGAAAWDEAVVDEDDGGAGFEF